MITGIFECVQYVRTPVDTGPQHASRHLPHPTALVVEKHLGGDRQHLVFAWTTCPFFAPITRERMHRPRSDHLVLVAQIIYEFGQCGCVHMMVQDHATTDTHSRFGMTDRKSVV